MHFLISGSNSGLGKFLHEKLSGSTLTRATSQEEWTRLAANGVDAIVHCAFNSAIHPESDQLEAYLEDNIFLTRKLLDIPHKRFIFTSSIDVYPKDGQKHNEETEVSIEAVGHLYGITKRISEESVLKRAKNPLVLRLSSLAGIYSRKNTLMKILCDEEPVLGLSAQSRLNFVAYKDVFDFIQYAIGQNLGGIYNIASSDSIDLQAIADLAGKKVKFGSVPYNPGMIDTDKVRRIFPRFKQSSLEVLKNFLNEEIFVQGQKK